MPTRFDTPRLAFKHSFVIVHDTPRWLLNAKDGSCAPAHIDIVTQTLPFSPKEGLVLRHLSIHHDAWRGRLTWGCVQYPLLCHTNAP